MKNTENKPKKTTIDSGVNWERFNQMQRGGQVMHGDQPHPRGVFRFKTWKEFNEWKSRCWIRFLDEMPMGAAKAAKHRRTPKRKR